MYMTLNGKTSFKVNFCLAMKKKYLSAPYVVGDNLTKMDIQRNFFPKKNINQAEKYFNFFLFRCKRLFFARFVELNFSFGFCFVY